MNLEQITLFSFFDELEKTSSTPIRPGDKGAAKVVGFAAGLRAASYGKVKKLSKFKLAKRNWDYVSGYNKGIDYHVNRRKKLVKAK